MHYNSLNLKCQKSEFVRDSEIAESKKEIGTLKQEIDRLDSEREILLSKIEAGDGVNTALQQLKQQNVRVSFSSTECFKETKQKN